MEIHKLVYHGDRQFESRHKPIEHGFRRENEKPKCSNLIGTNILGEPKYRDEKGNEYPNIESFQNRTSLPKI